MNHNAPSSTRWGRQWIESIRQLATSWFSRLQKGESYAEKGHVISLTVSSGRLSARVQGSRAKPYTTTIDIPAFKEGDWNEIIRQLAREARFPAQLLAGTMPRDIESLFARRHLQLFPRRNSEMIGMCNCPEKQRPCKHLAAVHFAFGEAVDRDPFLLFALRGADRDTLIRGLRRAWFGAEDGVDLSDDSSAAAELGVPVMPMSADRFNRSPDPELELAYNIKATDQPMLILNRLGMPPSWQLPLPIQQLLGPVYEAAVERALDIALADPAQRLEDEETEEGDESVFTESDFDDFEDDEDDDEDGDDDDESEAVVPAVAAPSAYRDLQERAPAARNGAPQEPIFVPSAPPPPPPPAASAAPSSMAFLSPRALGEPPKRGAAPPPPPIEEPDTRASVLIRRGAGPQPKGRTRPMRGLQDLADPMLPPPSGPSSSDLFADADAILAARDSRPAPGVAGRKGRKAAKAAAAASPVVVRRKGADQVELPPPVPAPIVERRAAEPSPALAAARAASLAALPSAEPALPSGGPTVRRREGAAAPARPTARATATLPPSAEAATWEREALAKLENDRPLEALDPARRAFAADPTEPRLLLLLAAADGCERRLSVTREEAARIQPHLERPGAQVVDAELLAMMCAARYEVLARWLATQPATRWTQHDTVPVVFGLFALVAAVGQDKLEDFSLLNHAWEGVHARGEDAFPQLELPPAPLGAWLEWAIDDNPPPKGLRKTLMTAATEVAIQLAGLPDRARDTARARRVAALVAAVDDVLRASERADDADQMLLRIRAAGPAATVQRALEAALDGDVQLAW